MAHPGRDRSLAGRSDGPRCRHRPYLRCGCRRHVPTVHRPLHDIADRRRHRRVRECRQPTLADHRAGGIHRAGPGGRRRDRQPDRRESRYGSRPCGSGRGSRRQPGSSRSRPPGPNRNRSHRRRGGPDRHREHDPVPPAHRVHHGGRAHRDADHQQHLRHHDGATASRARPDEGDREHPIRGRPLRSPRGGRAGRERHRGRGDPGSGGRPRDPGTVRPRRCGCLRRRGGGHHLDHGHHRGHRGADHPRRSTPGSRIGRSGPSCGCAPRGSGG